MIKPGLVSITFRNLTVHEIIDASVKAGIQGIEWGGDIHVPHGDIEEATETGRKTREAGLEVAAYGSYYRFDDDPVPFSTILNTALALKAPLIRAWAGKKGSGEADQDYYGRIVNEARAAGDSCAKAGIDLAFEYHGGTLTDRNESAARFMEDIGHPAVHSYWQPPVGMSKKDCLKGIDLISDYLIGVHVFHWGTDPRIRYLLSEGETLWREYLEKLSQIPGNRWALIEFVKDDKIDNFFRDAAALIGMLSPADKNEWIGVCLK